MTISPRGHTVSTAVACTAVLTVAACTARLQQDHADDHRSELDGRLQLAGASGAPEGEQ